MADRVRADAGAATVLITWNTYQSNNNMMPAKMNQVGELRILLLYGIANKIKCIKLYKSNRLSFHIPVFAAINRIFADIRKTRY